MQFLEFNLLQAPAMDEDDLSPLPPPAKDCESIYSISSINNDIPYPFDLFNEGRKTKPPRASFFERLKELGETERVFIKPVSKPVIKYIDENCQFEVLNKHGKPIFFALDTTDAWASTVFEGTKPFNVMILNYDYAEVLKLTGPGLSRLHGSAWVKHSGKVIGRIVQDDHLCSFSPTYSIEGTNEVAGLKVKGPPNSYATGLPPDPCFDAVLMDEASLVGKISKQWVLFCDPENPSEMCATPEEAYVLNFHPNMDLKAKCLLLSTVFMIDYQHYHKQVQAGVSRKCWIWFGILFFSLVVLILVGVDLIKAYQQIASSDSDALFINPNSTSNSNDTNTS